MSKECHTGYKIWVQRGAVVGNGTWAHMLYNRNNLKPKN